MKHLYWTYRREQIGSPYNLDWNLVLNWWYDASFFLNNQFWEWNKAWLTNIIDWQQLISDNRYTWEIVPWIKKLTRFMLCEYNEKYVEPEELSRSISNVWARFNIEMLDVELAKKWIRDNTDLIEEIDWHFILQEEYKDTISDKIIPTQYLIIE